MQSQGVIAEVLECAQRHQAAQERVASHHARLSRLISLDRVRSLHDAAHDSASQLKFLEAAKLHREAVTVFQTLLENDPTLDAVIVCPSGESEEGERQGCSEVSDLVSQTKELVSAQGEWLTEVVLGILEHSIVASRGSGANQSNSNQSDSETVGADCDEEVDEFEWVVCQTIAVTPELSSVNRDDLLMCVDILDCPQRLNAALTGFLLDSGNSGMVSKILKMILGLRERAVRVVQVAVEERPHVTLNVPEVSRIFEKASGRRLEGSLQASAVVLKMKAVDSDHGA